jgi:transcriptional regulator with XRE-family HTH domain
MKTEEGRIVEALHADKELAREFAKERLVLCVTERIREIMETEGITKADLARRWRVSKAHVSQLLSGSRNMTLKTLAEIMFLLDRAVRVSDTDFESSIGEASWSGTFELAWRSKPEIDYGFVTFKGTGRRPKRQVQNFDAA